MADSVSSFGEGRTDSIEKLAKSVLLKLQKKGVVLRIAPHLGENTETNYEIIERRTGRNVGRTQITVNFVNELLSRDWIKLHGSDFNITNTGVAWLRRSLSSADPFRAQHQKHSKVIGTSADGQLEDYLVNECESPLGWLRRRKNKRGKPLISDIQFLAGERIRADFWRAQMTPRVTRDWSQVSSNGRSRRNTNEDAHTFTESALAAKKRVLNALEAVGPELSGIILDVCCYLHGMEQAERNQGWPQRSGKVVLQIALTRLARYYGLINTPDLSQKLSNKIGHWGSEDFRPTLNNWQ